MKTHDLMDAIGQIDERYIQEAGEADARRHPHVLRRAIALAAAAVLCAALSISALAAADIGQAYDLLYSVSPAMAQSLKPVRMSCEDNGVRMYVESAGVDGSQATVLVSLRDMESDRVDATTDLFDSYSIRKSFDSSASCEMIRYDEDTQTASYQITITRLNDKDIRAGKVTFSVGCFLSGKEEHLVILPDEPIVNEQALLLENPPFRGGNGGTYESMAGDAVLAPQTIKTLTEGVQLTAVGFINGRLHVQIHYDDIRHTDNHGFVYSLDADGNRADCVANVSFWDAENSGSYEEYVFNVGREEYEQYTICGSFTTASRLTEGNWQVTFPLA